MKQKIINNRTLWELFIGEFVFGLLSQTCLVVAGIFWKAFYERPFYHSVGLWIGVAFAGCIAVHMNKSISAALDYDSETATKVMKKDSILRYAAITLVLAGIMLTDIVNPLTVFLGIMSLKISAYCQPYTYKLMDRVVGKEVLPDLIEFEENESDDKGFIDDSAEESDENNNEKVE